MISPELRLGLAYGLKSARRRAGQMLLPAITIATGSLLVVIVFAMQAGIRRQAAGLGHAGEIGHAVVLIAVTVLLVGVVEAAVATTRTIAHRTRELGVLGATGVRPRPVLVALLAEPVLTALAGSAGGAVIAAAAAAVAGGAGAVASGVSAGGTLTGLVIAIAVAVVAAALASVVPIWRAVHRPPVSALNAS